MKKQKIIKNEQAMINFGQLLGARLTTGMLILLTGDLGSGKTTLSKGIAKGLAVKEVVNSPTFNILKIYQGKIPFYHIDAYRLEDQSATDLGFETFFDGDGVCVIEWPEMIENDLPKSFLKIELKTLNDQRELSFHPVGKKYVQLCEELQ